MGVLFTCKSEKDWIKTTEKRLRCPLYIIGLRGFFSKCSKATNFIHSGLTCPKFKLVQALMLIRIICKYEQERIKTTEKTRKNVFSHYSPMGAIRCHGNQSFDPISSKP